MGEANEKYCEQVEKLRPSDCGTEKGDLALAATKKELAGKPGFLYETKL